MKNFPLVGQPFLSLSPLQISSLTIISGRLWVGTGGGAIFSIPLSISMFYLLHFKQSEIHSGLHYTNCPQPQRMFPSHIARRCWPSCRTTDTDKPSGSSLLHLVRISKLLLWHVTVPKVFLFSGKLSRLTLIQKDGSVQD